MDPLKLIKEMLAKRAERAAKRDEARAAAQAFIDASAAREATATAAAVEARELTEDEKRTFDAKVVEARAIESELRDIDERLGELYDQAIRDGKAAEIRSQFGGTVIEVGREALTYDRFSPASTE